MESQIHLGPFRPLRAGAPAQRPPNARCPVHRSSCPPGGPRSHVGAANAARRAGHEGGHHAVMPRRDRWRRVETGCFVRWKRRGDRTFGDETGRDEKGIDFGGPLADSTTSGLQGPSTGFQNPRPSLGGFH